MSVLLATLCLNEMEWLPKLYLQHRNWPGLARWVFVEAADTVYAAQNPERVTPEGLSVDGTSGCLRALAEVDPRVTYIAHGFTSHARAEAGKIAARQRYLEIAEEVRPNYVIVLDADEFYTRLDQERLPNLMDRFRSYWAFTFPRREIWRPPSCIDQPLFSQEVVGGFWQIPCCHWWRWSPGLHYDDCHNTPKDIYGRYLNNKLFQLHGGGSRICEEVPQMIHLGFAARREDRLAKNAYYAARGERRDKMRKWYVESRARWEMWKPGDVLPRDAHVIPYTGPVPEVFRVEP